MQVLVIVLASLSAVALVGFIIWKTLQDNRKERYADELHREVLEMEAVERERVLRDLLTRGEDLIRRLEVDLREDGAAWEAEASRQMIHGVEKAESSGFLLDKEI